MSLPSAARSLLAASLLLAAPATLAQTPPAAPLPGHPRVVRVSGTGEVKATPDEVFIDLAVEALAATAKASGEQNAQKMEKVLAALVASGLARKELQTRAYSVYPEYAPTDGNQKPRLQGYRSNNTVTVHLTDLTRAGPTLDKALGAGANRVDSVRFGLTQADAAQAEALRRAVARARASAQAVAAALGVKLGAVLEASTVADAPPSYPMMRSEAMAKGGGDASDTAIQPQEQTVTAQVSLVFAIER